MEYEVKNLDDINTEEESQIGYVFQNKSGHKEDSLKNLQRINFFIGANNSGKSRFLRSIFDKEIESIFSDSRKDDVFKNLISHHKLEFLGFIENQSSSVHSFFNSFLDVNYSSMTVSSNKKDLSFGEKFAYYLKDRFNNQDLLKDGFLRSRMPNNDRIKNLLIPEVQKINNKYIKMVDPFNPYLPLCANIVVASNLGGRHAVFEFGQAWNSEKSFTA